MNVVDMGLISLFLMSLIYGYRRGFVGQAISLLGLLVSFTVAYSFSQNTAVYLRQQFPLPKESPNPLLEALQGMVSLQHFFYSAFAFILLFFISRFLWRVMGKLLDSVASLPIISMFNRWLGAIFSLLQVLLIIVLSINLIVAIPGEQWKNAVYHSYISQYILQISPFLSEKVKILPRQKINMPSDPFESL
ncbi:MAG TPA: CvpA family protein [Bacillota bacterium]|nr:CvpA family protein [Bacillota bacterium]